MNNISNITKLHEIYRDANDRKEQLHNIKADIALARLCCEIIGFAYQIDEDLLGKTRGAPKNAFARQLAMYLAHTGFGMSYYRVSIAFGRDRSTIAHACHLIEDKRDDAKFDNFVDDLNDLILNIPKAAIAA